MKTLIVLITGLSLLLGSSGCTTAGSAGAKTPTESTVTATELLARLSRFYDRLSTTIQATAELVKERTTKVDIRKRALIWEMTSIQNCRDAVFQRDHLVALIDTWALCVQMRTFFESGDGKEGLGEHTGLALKASRELEADMERVAAAALPEESFPKARETVRDFAASHPMHGACVREPLRPYLAPSGESDPFGWILDTSLSPLRAIGGMDHTAQSIHAAALVGAELSSTIKLLPQQTRWESELLLCDIEERPTVVSSVASLQTLSHSSEALSKTADRLPEELQTRFTAMLEEFEGRQVEFRATMAEARKTLAGVREASSELHETVGALALAAANWEKALHVFRLVVQELSPDPDAGEEATEPGPSVIEILGNTAREIAMAGGELRGAVAEVHQLINAEGIDETADRINATVDRTDAKARRLASHLTLLSAVIMAVFFVGLFSYRFAVGRFLKDKS